MTNILGIDLGTTFSAAATVATGGQAEILVNRDGDRLTPSVVLFETPTEVLIGTLAKRSAAVQPDDCVQFVKRQMGETAPVYVGQTGKEYRAEEISALILRRVAEDASEALGCPVRDVVITVPAYFDDARRRATQDAGELAGLNVVRLINEPTAAAICYGMKAQEDGVFMVYDLGGGTFDVTIMRVRGDDFTVLATDGDRNLGGFDFDNKLIAHISGMVVGRGGPDVNDDSSLAADLRERCEAAKIRLSRSGQAPIHLSAGGRPYRFQVSRAEFEQMCADLLYRTEVLVEAVLEESGLAWGQIDRVLLVGGSTRMPMVQALVERLSGHKPVSGVNPDEVVALGAAIVGASIRAEAGDDTPLAAPVSVSDVTSQGLGTLALEPDTDREVNVVIIPRNSPIPCKFEETFYTIHPDQRKLKATITEGEDEDPDYVAVLHTSMLDLLPGLPDHAPIKVIMSYDIDGVVHMETVDLTNNRSLGEVELDRPNNLDSTQMAKRKDALRTLGLQ